MSPLVAAIPKEKGIEIGEFLTNNVSRAAVYALLHKQPLTRREIERSPLTDSMRRLSLSAQTRTLKDKSGVQMRTLLAKGVDCGVLLAVSSKRQNYYFLNSDLRVEPAPIRESEEPEDEVAVSTFIDRTLAHTPGQAVLPAWGTAADHTILPVPYIDTPKSLMMWMSWLVTPTRRQILNYIGQQGTVTRPKLRADLGFWADRIVAKEGVPAGVLERTDDKIRYQFSSFSFSRLKVKKEDEGKRRSWTSFPPAFWLTRSYEPLRCIMGSSRLVGDRKPEMTPTQVLEELAKGDVTIIEKNRHEFLEVNFLERMSFYAMYHSSGDPAVRISADSLIPDKVLFNSPDHPLVWVSKTDEDHAGARLDFKHEAAMMLISKKTKEDQVAFLEKMLRDMAMERIGKRLDEHNRLLARDLDKLRMESFGLGAESIAAVAGLELTREQIEGEKAHFEKFLNILVPGSVPKKKPVHPEQAAAELSGDKDPTSQQ
jgi:hypothetical protein